MGCKISSFMFYFNHLLLKRTSNILVCRVRFSSVSLLYEASPLVNENDVKEINWLLLCVGTPTCPAQLTW